MRDAVVAALAQLPAHLRRTLTWDQGSEMALHEKITAALDLPVYFADPHSPWQRPTNENTYWRRPRTRDSLDGRSPAGPSGGSENTCRKARR